MLTKQLFLETSFPYECIFHLRIIFFGGKYGCTDSELVVYFVFDTLHFTAP